MFGGALSALAGGGRDDDQAMGNSQGGKNDLINKALSFAEDSDYVKKDVALGSAVKMASKLLSDQDSQQSSGGNQSMGSGGAYDNKSGSGYGNDSSSNSYGKDSSSGYGGSGISGDQEDSTYSGNQVKANLTEKYSSNTPGNNFRNNRAGDDDDSSQSNTGGYRKNNSAGNNPASGFDDLQSNQKKLSGNQFSGAGHQKTSQDSSQSGGGYGGQSGGGYGS